MAVTVQQGKVLDYIHGVTQRAETPEEYVRQEITKSPVREYEYQMESGPCRKDSAPAFGTGPPSVRRHRARSARGSPWHMSTATASRPPTGAPICSNAGAPSCSSGPTISQTP